MKNITEIRNNLLKVNELSTNVIYSDVKPTQQIIDTYQEIFDMFHFILTSKRTTLELKLENLRNQPASDEISSFFQNKIEALIIEIKHINNSLSNLSKYIILGGGSLSEYFIDGYEKDFKDVDIFIDMSPFEHIFNNINITGETSVQYEEKPEYYFILESFGFESNTNQFNTDSHYLENANIHSIYKKKCNNKFVELIFVKTFKTNFDLSFREYFYNGDTIFYTDAAEKDRKNKEISVKSFASPFSTLLRLEEFKNRYPLSVNKFSREQLMKYIKVNFYKTHEQLLEKFSLTKKYNDKSELALSLVNEISSLSVSPFESDLLKQLKGNRADSFFLFQERMKTVLLDEKNNVSYILDHTFEIKPLNFDDNYFFVIDSQDKKKFYELITSNLHKTRIKKAFTSNKYGNKRIFIDFFFNDLEKNNIKTNIYRYGSSDRFHRALDMFILTYHLEHNPSYKIEDFLRDGSFLKPDELITMYYAATSKYGTIKMNISNLVFETAAPHFLFYYDEKQTVGIDLITGISINKQKDFNIKILPKEEFAYFFKERYEEINQIIPSILNFTGKCTYLTHENKSTIISLSNLDESRKFEYGIYLNEAYEKIKKLNQRSTIF